MVDMQCLMLLEGYFGIKKGVKLGSRFTLTLTETKHFSKKKRFILSSVIVTKLWNEKSIKYTKSVHFPKERKMLLRWKFKNAHELYPKRYKHRGIKHRGGIAVKKLHDS